MKNYVLVVAVAASLGVAGCGQSETEKQGNAPGPSGAAISQDEHNQRLYRQMEVVEPTDIGLAYMLNGVAADERFKNNDFRMKATVRRVKNIGDGVPVAILKMADDQITVQLKGSLASNAARLMPGAEVEWVCIGAGDVPLQPIAVCREPTGSELGKSWSSK